MEFVEIGNLSGYFDGSQWHEGPFSVSIKNGNIQSINSEKIDADIDGTNKFLSVPFVDGHTHLIFGGDRSFELALKLEGASYAEIFEKGGGIHSTVEHTRNASDDELLDLVLARLDLMLQNGTQLVEAKSGYGLTAEQEIRLLRILKRANEKHSVEIVSTYCGAHALPRNVHRVQYVDEVISILPQVKKENLATSTDVFCDRGAFNVEETVKILQASVQEDLPIRVHAEELEYTGIGKIASEKFNALSVDHLLLSKEDDFKVYEKSKSTAMFMPAATIGLFTNQRPQGWQDSSTNIGLGSDFNPNNMVISMQTAIRLAVYLYKMTPIKAIVAATSGSYQGITGGAYSPLREGDVANFNLINQPGIDRFVTRFDQNLVSHVFKNGNLIFEYS